MRHISCGIEKGPNDSETSADFSVIFQAEERQLYRQPYKWLVFSKSAKNFVVPPMLSLLPDSRFVSVVNCDNTTYCFKYLYKYCKSNGSYVESDVGIWSERGGFMFHEYTMFPSRKRVDLNGTLIKISYVVTKNETLNHLWDYRFGAKC